MKILLKNRILIVVCFVLVTVFAFFQINKIIKIIELTSINVKTETPLNIETVKVYQGYYSINRKSDAEMFNDTSNQVVFDGKGNGKIKTEYGENDFLVTYDNKYYFQFRQFCTNSNDYYKYDLKVFKKANKLCLKAVIDKEIKFERPMNLMSDAKKLRCNKIIDEEKGYYNGIEFN
jgi:hypothetical protein